ISGRVQGVFFRASTREQAQRLKLGGYAKNSPDGTVEVLACGEALAIDQLEHWLQHGPPSACVQGVTRTSADESMDAAFYTR
ncbi:MAG: acylphosphatase, partial [Rudaea sp.]